MIVRQCVWALLVLAFTDHASATDCLASCPVRPIGIMMTSMGGLFVSPAKIPPSFSGCQIAWDEQKTRRIRIRFANGKIQQFEAFNTGTSPNSFACSYEDGKLSLGSSPECADMRVEQLSAGLSAIPVEDAQMEWPEGQCFPRLLSSINRPVAPKPPTPSLELIAGSWLGVSSQFDATGKDYPRTPFVLRLIINKDGTGRLIIANLKAGKTTTKEITRTEINGHEVFFYGAHFPGRISIWGELLIGVIGGNFGPVQLMREDQLIKGVSETGATAGDHPIAR